MSQSAESEETVGLGRSVGGSVLNRRALIGSGVVIAGAWGAGVGLDAASAPGSRPLDADAEARKIAFDRMGSGDRVILISGFPQTRLSWNRLIPLISHKFEAVPADLPSFGDSGVLDAPATTENVARVFHALVANEGAPLHVVAHDFGAWVAYSWALAEVMEKLDKGEVVDPANYYFRMMASFETGGPKYDWINRILAVGAGGRPPDGPI